MKNEKKLHCGAVALVGRPNTGKSTLLNYILGEKVAIVSTVPQTTRHKIKGIFTDSRGQIVFIDTPGMHLPSQRMGKLMLREIDLAIAGSDLIIHLVDTQEPPGEEEGLVLNKLKNVKVPVILGLNKIDCRARFLPSYIKLWEEQKGKKIQELSNQVLLIPLSGKTGTNVDKLLATIFEYLPQGDFLYPPEILTDFPQRLAIAEIIREKLFSLMRQEVPHSLAVYIDELESRSPRLVYIRAIIIVERSSQKAIVVGKDAGILKAVGLAARLEIEALLGQRAYLETQVKVKPGWREDPEILRLLGYL